MYKLKSNLIFLTVLTLLLSGCTYRILDFTVISSKNIDLTQTARLVRGKNRVEGLDRVHWIIMFPTGRVNMKEALDHAIESTPGCVALLDGVVHYKFWYIPCFYGRQSVTVEGTPLIDPALVVNSEPIPAYGRMELDKSGSIKKVDILTEMEYAEEKEKISKESQGRSFSHSVEVQ